MKQRTLEFEPGDLVCDVYTSRNYNVGVGIVTESSFYYNIGIHGTKKKIWFAVVYWPDEGTTQRINQHWLEHYKPENS
jgi:hypothetical protein